MIDITKINFKKMDGLVAAIIQNAETKQVLMLGYMNEEALFQTLKTGRVTFWSRSKQRLWTKGETSNNFLNLVDIRTDCDSDTLLIYTEPEGPTCHKEKNSCFGEIPEKNILESLFKLIEARKVRLPEESYTSSLFREGLNKITAKVEEEAEEVCRAAKEETKERVAEEAGDLIYHLFVLLVESDVSIKEVKKVLESRKKPLFRNKIRVN